jgi:hypothetical protein
MNQLFLTCGRALCATTFGLACSAFAGESVAPLAPAGNDMFAPRYWQPVSDSVLAKQTGKGLGGDTISGFVLNVLSQWQLPNGATASASGALAVATNALNQVSAQVNSTAGITDPRGTWANATNSNNSATGGQAVSVNGVSQITQVAGNNNLGTNQTLIDFNVPSAAQNYNNALSAAASNANGSIKASVSFGNGGISVALQTPSGIATQNIVPGNTQQAAMIAQLLQVAGNNQQVNNQLQLHLQVQSMSSAALRQAGVQQALQSALSLRR